MGGENFPPARNVTAAKYCDACKSAPSILFCRNDHMYMCITCDSKLHANNRHARVWLCDVCEQGPSSVTCKADAASLCVTCDRDIHSANSLASRHDRVPVVPFYEPVVFLLKSVGNVFLDGPATPAADESEAAVIEDHASSCPRNEEETNNSWLSFNSNVSNKISAADMKSMELLFTDPENLLEFDYPGPDETEHSLYKHRPETDSVVPVQINSKPPVPSILMDESSTNKHFEIDFTNSKIVSFTTPQLNSQNANNCELREQASSKTVVMPDYGSSMSSLGMNIELTKAKSSQMSTDREARVMRYREKRKNRKFEKTIRYASRKAYAETRPRVKGRFVKRSKMEIDSHNHELRDNGDRWFTLDRGMNSTFGVVPKLDRMY